MLSSVQIEIRHLHDCCSCIIYAVVNPMKSVLKQKIFLEISLSRTDHNILSTVRHRHGRCNT